MNERKIRPDPDFPGYSQLAESRNGRNTRLNLAMKFSLDRLVRLAARRAWDRKGVDSAIEAVRIAEVLKKQALK